jgi:dynein heavy chain 1
LFLIIFKRTSRALLHRDHVLLAVVLAQIKTRGVDGGTITDDLEFLLESGDVSTVATAAASGDGPGVSFLSGNQQQRLSQYSTQSLFRVVSADIEGREAEWRMFVESEEPERVAPWPWEEDLSGMHILALGSIPPLTSSC